MRKLLLLCLLLISSSSFGIDNEFPEHVDKSIIDEIRKQDTHEVAEEGQSRFFWEFMYMLLILGVIVAALILISWALKKMMYTRIEQMNVTNGIKVLERRALTQKTSIYLLEVGGKGLLIADSINGVTTITECDVDAIS